MTNPTPLLRTLALTTLVAIAPALAQEHGSSTRNQTSRKSMGKPGLKMVRTGLNGYCPVCVVEMKKWEKGNARIQSTFDGVAYYFPSKAVKAKFDANPEKYVPALNGDCTVCYAKMGKRAPGSIQHAALHKKRLYLFPSEKQKSMFLADPRAFEKTDLAANGECIVCLAKMNKHVPGSAKHTVIHDGFRYQFPSEKEAMMFRKSPEQFVKAVKTMKKAEGMRTDRRVSNTTTVRFAGRSGCAGCEFGVKPINAPQELGLAIVSSDGRVTVVEDAHSKYPAIYKARFNNKQLVVEGTVLKTQGKVTWVQPNSLTMTN